MLGKRILFASCGLAAALFGGAAAAQTTERSSVLEEVVVTAQKRSENLQDVPIAITAVSAEALQRQGVQDFSQLSKVAPEVVASPGTFTNIAIRGVRATAFAPTTESPNAVHLDGAFIARFTSLQAMFFDIERIEVLAGPQGTLYGRNSAGGTINLITRRPQTEFGGNVSLEVGTHSQLVFEGGVNLPVSDTLAVRLAYRHYSHDGYYIDTGLDDAKQDGVRLSSLWRPTERDELLFTADYQKVGGKGVSANITQTLAANIIPPANIRRNQALVGSAEQFSQDTDGWGVMLQYDHDFDFATLTFQASSRETHTSNVTGSLTGWLQTAFAPSRIGFLEANSKWNSQELRLTSNGEGPLKWVAGLYRFHEKSYDNDNGLYAWFNDPGLGPPFVNGQYTLQVASPLRIFQTISNPLQETDAWAVFGEATWTPPGLERLHLTLGARYNDEEKTANGFNISNQVRTFQFTGTGQWDATTYKASAAFDFTPDNMVYASYSTGFKSGGFAYGVTVGFRPEYIDAYEIGTKNRFLDGRLQVNAAAWFYDYQDYQNNVLANSVVGGQPISTITVLNAGGAEIYGQSVAVNAVVTENDLLNLSVQHLDAKYTQFDLRNVPGVIGGTNLSNTPIGLAPDWVATGVYDHIFRLPTGDLDLQLAVQYNGDRLLTNSALPGTPGFVTSGTYVTGDVSLRYTPSHGQWSAQLFVRNVTDETYWVGRAYTAGRYYTSTLGPPRVAGFSIRADF